MSSYDTIGAGYAATRRSDPRIAAQLHRALDGATTVLNVGAGTGSYEPASTVLAVEPSAVMIAQRPLGAAPAVRARAEALPLAGGAVEAVMAVLTVHHWADVDAGLAELMRVARRRIVILSFDPALTSRFWLLDEYLPQLALTHPGSSLALEHLTAELGEERTTVSPMPVPHDCSDGFASAFWRRPAAYLDASMRAGMSLFAHTDPSVVAEGLQALERDLADGTWQQRHADLLEQEEYDAGYRLLVTDLK